MEEKKINVKQIVNIFSLGVIAPVLRGFSIYISEISGQASLASSIFSFIELFFLICIVKEFFKKNPNRSLEDIFSDILGNVLGKIVLIIILLWTLLLGVLNTRIMRNEVCFICVCFIFN